MKSKLQISATFAFFQRLNNRSLEIPVLGSLSFALDTSTALEFFCCSEKAAYPESKQLYPNEKNSMPRVFLFCELSSLDSNCRTFERISFLQSGESLQARFPAGVVNDSFHDVLESCKSAIHRSKALPCSYTGKSYFATFSKELPRKEANIH